MLSHKINKNILKKICAGLISFSLMISFTTSSFANNNDKETGEAVHPITCLLTETDNHYKDFMRENDGLKGLFEGKWAIIDMFTSYFRK